MNPFAATGLLSGLISAGTGLVQMGKANKLLGGLQYPTEQLPQEFETNQTLANQMASQGMPSEQYNQAMRNIQRQQLTAIRYANDRRAGAGLIPTIQAGTNDATLNLDAQNAQQRIANQRQLMTVNNWVGTQKRDLFQKNTRDKYNRDYDYGMTLKGVGNQNFVGGLDKLASGGLAAFSGGGGKGSGGYGYSMTQQDFQRD